MSTVVCDGMAKSILGTKAHGGGARTSRTSSMRPDHSVLNVNDAWSEEGRSVCGPIRGTGEALFYIMMAVMNATTCSGTSRRVSRHVENHQEADVRAVARHGIEEARSP